MPVEISAISVERIAVFLAIVLAAFVAGNIIHALITKLLRQNNVTFWGYYLVSKITFYVLYIWVIYYSSTTILGFNVAEFITGLSILGLAVLLASMPTIQNYVSGILIFFDRPFREGDYVEYNSMTCKVIDISLRKTKMRSLDGKIVTVPNSLFYSGPMISYTKGEYIKVTLPISVSHEADAKKAKDIMLKACIENKDVLPHASLKMSPLEALISMPKDMKKLEPKVLLKDISKDRAVFELWFWINKISRKDAIVSDVLGKIKEEFEKEGLKFG